MNDAFDFRDIVSFCFVVDSHPCLHLFRFERLRLCWCKVRQLSGGGGWGVSSLILCTYRDSVSKMALLWVFLFRPWLTIFLFWNIALTFKLREVPPRYSGLQSLSGTPRKIFVSTQVLAVKFMWSQLQDWTPAGCPYQRFHVDEYHENDRAETSQFGKIENHRYRSSVDVWTEDCDSCAVGEDGMEELVWTMRRMELWRRHARCEALLVGNCDCASR